MEVARLISLGDCEESMNLGKAGVKSSAGARAGEMGERLRRDGSRSFARAGEGWKCGIASC